MILTELVTPLKNRENLYRLLSRIYMNEVDEELLSRMKKMIFPKECGDTELNEGYRLLESYLLEAAVEQLTELAVDYARVFLGAGMASHLAAYPYESVYSGTKRIMMQDDRDEVVKTYAASGLEKSKNLGFPEDHIALELEYMAFLCKEARTALETGQQADALARIKEQAAFLEKRLLNWTPKFCADVGRFAETDFYRAAAKITGGFIRIDRVIIEDLISVHLPAANA